MNSLANTLGARLKEERLRLGLTQEELAEKTEVQPITIIQYEKRKSFPSVKFIFNLQELNFDIIYLLTGKQEFLNLETVPHEIIAEIASAIDFLENKLADQPFNNENRVKLTIAMLNQYVKHIETKNNDTPKNPSKIVFDLLLGV